MDVGAVGLEEEDDGARVCAGPLAELEYDKLVANTLSCQGRDG